VPIDKWIGFAKKSNAKLVLTKNFILSEDYVIMNGCYKKTAAVISAADVSLTHFNLDSSGQFYLSNETEPIGMVATRMMRIGEIIGSNDLSSAIDAMSTSAVPISVRSVDVATGLNIGEDVDIYWVLDTHNGEDSMDPILILGGVTLLSYDDAGKSFGSDIGLSVAVEETQVLRLLSATTIGRLVVIRSHV
jgi:hypothetical protein